jgi:tetratricopeptide (TPR) repeat protein
MMMNDHQHRRNGSYEDQSFPILVSIIVVLLAIGIGFFYWYQKTQQPEFSDLYKTLAIEPLPASIESASNIKTRLEQLNREPCYREAAVGLGRALLDLGYPREAAISLRSFVRHCGSAREVLPWAHEGLVRVSDYSGALEVASELVAAAPENGNYRYWRAIAYHKLGNFTEAIPDYINSIQLVPETKTVRGNVFYGLSRTYEALKRPCDAITPLEMYISLDPVKRRTSQLNKLIADYAASGSCDARYATGTARLTFVGQPDVRLLPVLINGVEGNFILDTGATFVATHPKFAARARISIQPEQQIIVKIVGGQIWSEIGYAETIKIGNAEAAGVLVAVTPGENPFGNRIDGLLGMSFLSRFNVTLSTNSLELKAIGLR